MIQKKLFPLSILLFISLYGSEFEIPLRSPQATSIWVDGQLVPWDDATTHMLSYGLHYGVGVFEGIRVYDTEKGPAIFRLADHVARLYYSFDCFAHDIPYDQKEVERAIIDTVRANGITNGYIRPLVYLGYGQMGLYYKSAPVQCMIAAWNTSSHTDRNSIYAKISPFIRIHPKSTHIDKKICGHYVNSVLALIDARDDGYNDAILLDCDGYIAEGLAANVFMVKDGVLYTPRLGSILPGITRDTIMQLAENLGIECIEKKISIAQIMSADEAFFTGTALGIAPIHRIDGASFSYLDSGSITSRLQCAYDALVTGNSVLDESWLTYVNWELHAEL